jgi:ribose transport system permease protein
VSAIADPGAPAAPVPPDERIAPSRFKWISFGLREAGIGVALGVIVLVFCVTAENFATQTNFTNILVQIAINTVLAVGMTFVILVGGIDLSVGSVLALASVIGAKILSSAGLSSEVSLILAFAACIGAGIGCGLVNGFVSERWAVPSFIVTLGMLNMARGGSSVLSDNSTVNVLRSDVVEFGSTILLGVVPIIFVIALATVVIAWFVLRYTSSAAWSTPSARTRRPSGSRATTRGASRSSASRSPAPAPGWPPSSSSSG